MDANEFLSTARDLLSSAKREGDFRSCISRAYYSVYHTACAAIREGVNQDLRIRAGITRKEGLEHRVLISYLKNASDGEVKEAGDELYNLRAARVRADYHLWRSIDKTRAREAIDDASEQCVRIDGLTARRIGEAIAPYLKTIYP